MNQRRKIDVNPGNSIGAIVILVLFLFALYFIAKGIFNILLWVSPFMLVGALIINHNVVIDYVKMLFNLLKNNPLVGIAGVILTFVLYPVVFAFLLGKALLYRKLGQVSEEIKKRTEGQYTDYEEVGEIKETRLELPEINERPKKVKVKRGGIDMRKQKKSEDDYSDYEELFD